MQTYNVSKAAHLLGISRQTLHAWIRKRWVTPKLDYRNYPVFSEEDIKKIKVWRKTLREP